MPGIMVKEETLVIRKGLIEKTTKKGIFILTPDGKKLFALNGVSGVIWDFLKRNKNRNEIIEGLTSRYTVGKERAGKDLDILIKKIRKYSHDLIEDPR